MISQVACPDPSVDTIHGIPANFSFSLLFSVFLLAAWLATVAESVPHLLMGFSFVLLSAYFFLESLSRQPLYVCVRLCVCVCVAFSFSISRSLSSPLFPESGILLASYSTKIQIASSYLWCFVITGSGLHTRKLNWLMLKGILFLV